MLIRGAANGSPSPSGRKENIMSITAKEALERTMNAHVPAKINGKTMQDKIKEQDAAIERAAEQGHFQTICVVTGTVYDEWQDKIHEHYTSLGYRYKPIGYVGGVWQSGSYIYW